MTHKKSHDEPAPAKDAPVQDAPAQDAPTVAAPQPEPTPDLPHDPASEIDPAPAPGRGAQVRLTGEAQAAARGGLHNDMEANAVAKKELEQSGQVPDGTTPDGSPNPVIPPKE